MRYLSNDGRWVSTEAAPEMPTSEGLVQAGLLHPDNLGLAHFDLIKDGIVPTTMVRLTDGPGGQARWASYLDVMMTNPWGYGTIHTIARGLARLPLKLYESELTEDTEPGTVHTIINPDRSAGPGGKIAWALRYPNSIAGDAGTLPNSPPSRRSLWYGTVVNKLIYGNALWEIRRDKSGICGFTFHPAHRVEMDEDNLIYKIKEEKFDRFVFDAPLERRTERVLSPDRVVHYGLWETGKRPWNPSPVVSLHMTVALYDAVTRHMVSYFNNGARVSGHVKVEPNTSQRARQQIREEILKLYAGPEQSGRVLITSGEWQAFHKEPEFAGIVQLIKHSRDEIFVTYGVPPPVMGVIERAIMANVREMRDQYVRDLVGPHAEFLAGDFEAQVLDREPKLRDKNTFAYFDVDEQLRPDLWKRAASFRNLMLAYTPDELRRIERQKPLDMEGSSDTIWRPLNEGPLTNMPDYTRREDLQERRVAVEERRLELEAQQAEQEQRQTTTEDSDDAE